MNKVFKIIWNKTTQSLVVTSELAKGEAKASSSSSSKNSTTGKFFKLSVLALFFSQICDVAYAAVTATNRDTLVRTDARGAIAIAGGQQVIKIVHLLTKVMGLSLSVGE